MDMASFKAGVEAIKEVSDVKKEMDSFNPDERIIPSKEVSEIKGAKHVEGFDPDKRIEKIEYYTTEKDRIDQSPTENSDFGTWEGERGNSKFIPSDETESGKRAKDKLAEYGQNGIEYKNGVPEFSPCSEATVQIDHMTENRYDYYGGDGTKQEGNFTQADKQCAKQWSEEGKLKEDGSSHWKEEDVAKWRKDNQCSWHECSDTKTMHLVSRDIHDPGKFTHSGGCAECRIRDKKDIGGIFDE